jgi:hypothetical protein
MIVEETADKAVGPIGEDQLSGKEHAMRKFGRHFERKASQLNYDVRSDR